MSDLEFSPNSVHQLEVVLTPTPMDAGDPAIDWEVTGNTDTRTSVSNTGVIKLGPAETGPLTVTATWVNDAGDTDSLTVGVTVDPAGEAYWPQPSDGSSGGGGDDTPTLTLKLTDSEGREVSTVAAGSTAYVTVVGVASAAEVAGYITGTVAGSAWQARPAEMWPIVGIVFVDEREPAGTVLTAHVDGAIGSGTATLTVSR